MYGWAAWRLKAQNLGDIMLKIAAAVSGAVLLAGSVVLLSGMAPLAASGAAASSVNTQAKGDRLDLRNFGPGCSEQSWPYYEADCIHSVGHAKPVRVIATDRLPATIRFATSH
jgi:hypothetical protein